MITYTKINNNKFVLHKDGVNFALTKEQLVELQLLCKVILNEEVMSEVKTI